MSSREDVLLWKDIAIVDLFVFGDWGRDAGIRFADLFSVLERDYFQKNSLLQPDERFLDEHRRSNMSVIGNLTYIKEDILNRVSSAEKKLDDRVLLGFPGGPSIEEIVPRMTVSLVEAIRMSVMFTQGKRKILITFPCNTISPAVWAVEKNCKSKAALVDAYRNSNWNCTERDNEFFDKVVQLVQNNKIKFISVADAVLAFVATRETSAVLPLGTSFIADIYQEAANRLTSRNLSPYFFKKLNNLKVIKMNTKELAIVLKMISYFIDADVVNIEMLKPDFHEIINKYSAIYPDLTVFEACTDLDLKIGFDSTRIYAEQMVHAIYNPQSFFN